MDKQGYKPLYDENGNLLELEIGGIYEALVWHGSLTEVSRLKPARIVITEKHTSLGYYDNPYKFSFYGGKLDGQSRWLSLLSREPDMVGKKIGYDARYSDEYKALEARRDRLNKALEGREMLVENIKDEQHNYGSVLDALGIQIYAIVIELEAEMQAIVDEKSKLFEED